jgi:hypothetical protein
LYGRNRRRWYLLDDGFLQGVPPAPPPLQKADFFFPVSKKGELFGVRHGCPGAFGGLSGFPACKFRYQFAYALVVGGGNVGQFCLGLLGYGEVQM